MFDPEHFEKVLQRGSIRYWFHNWAWAVIFAIAAAIAVYLNVQGSSGTGGGHGF